jgi:hypothetical protein
MADQSISTVSGQLRVPRKASIHRDDQSHEPKLLADWRATDAYVLLGDPGAGKSWCFETESKACGGLLISARDIVDKVAPADVGDKIVFIDGLDEVRAGASDSKTPFGAIREWLHRIGRPRFRLSCREADWLGESDSSALARVAPNEHIEVLHLEPLTQDDVLAVLRDRPGEVPDPEKFWHEAERFGLTELFGNPLLLDLTIKAVTQNGGQWPSTRHDIYDAACRQLATEASIEHRAVKPLQPGEIDRLLNDAGLLCAVLLLSNKQSWSLESGGSRDTVELSSLPEELVLHDARTALASKVFTTVACRSTPRHRSIAEFLAAKALAKRIEAGLPIGRLLALIQGFDGIPVEPLRGLFAWLVVHHAHDRLRLIQLDPLGIVLNGDVAALSVSERLALLATLNQLAQKNRWFRQNTWVSHPFGPLATADMESTFDSLLSEPKRSDAHQAFIDCVLDALRHGERMPELGSALEVWIEDATAQVGNRLAAYEAWKHNVGFQPAKVLDWLERIVAGNIIDNDDQLIGALLTDLYPEHLGPRKVLSFLRPTSRRDLIAEYSMFWRYELLRKSRPEDFADLADAWIEVKPTSIDSIRDYDVRELSGEVLAAALTQSGDTVSTERLYAWLGICLDEYGFSKLVHDSQRSVASWLEARPDRIKQVTSLGYRSIQRDKHGHRFFWESEQRLHGAKKPRDWLPWLLALSDSTNDEELAKYCFGQVASAVVDPPLGFCVPTMEELERWVNAHAENRPNAHKWLEFAWTCDLEEDWRGDQHRTKLKYQAEQAVTRQKRQAELKSLLPILGNGKAPVGLLHQLAFAYQKRFTDINGETPLERVQDFLVSDVVTAQAALKELDLTLARDDLPSVDEIFDLEAEKKYHLIRPAALLAASRSIEYAHDSTLSWVEDLAQKLVAFYLTDGLGNMPGWYKDLAAYRPEIVAPILLRHAIPKLKTKNNTGITALWALSHETGQKELARLVLPTLLDRFPLRTNETNRRELNHSLLAALHLLDTRQATRIVKLKLEQPGLDPIQRVCWLVAKLPYSAEAAEELANWVGKNERRAIALGEALHQQGNLGRVAHQLSPRAVRHLIEVLAPITPHEIGSQGGIVTSAHDRAMILRSLLTTLSSNPSVASNDELKAMSESDRLGTWREYVDYSARAQQTAAREARFQAAEPTAVALVISNLAPANAADLQALVVQHLSDIEAELRGENTHLVRQFWRLGSKANGNIPQEENYCRDLLLEKLRLRLKPLGINVEREASAAADKRVDMRAEFMRSGLRIAVPIELKKEDSDKLWTAWRDQLQRLYIIDPATGGYGIYLVLWFNKSPRANPEGLRPQSASEMRNLIVERMPEIDRTRLAAQVLDLSLSVTS